MLTATTNHNNSDNISSSSNNNDNNNNNISSTSSSDRNSKSPPGQDTKKQAEFRSEMKIQVLSLLSLLSLLFLLSLLYLLFLLSLLSLLYLLSLLSFLSLLSLQSGQMGPAPGRFELSEGMLKWTQAAVLGPGTLELKCCEFGLWVRLRFDTHVYVFGYGIDPQTDILWIEIRIADCIARVTGA